MDGSKPAWSVERKRSSFDSIRLGPSMRDMLLLQDRSGDDGSAIGEMEISTGQPSKAVRSLMEIANGHHRTTALLELADRILVIFEGSIVYETSRQSASRAAIGHAMAGSTAA